MSQQSFEVSSRIHDSFRVRQIAGMFDVPLGEKLTERFTAELPSADDAWQVGLIVGPSGAGKSTVARQTFGAQLYEPGIWPSDTAVIDALFAAAGNDAISIKHMVGLLTAVGFSSPPAWVKPYGILSNGERFRCDLARSLVAGLAASDAPPTVVFDEFTSVVDRDVARACAAAVGKAVRSQQVRGRFVAVTCHYDVEPWLAPDWTLDMATGRLAWRSLRRPESRLGLELEVRRCGAGLWPLFARHHYLSAGLSWGARCYAALCRGRPVAFCAVLAQFARRAAWRISRLVTLPDYQGLGIGTRMAEAIGDAYLAAGQEFGVTAAHPALLAHCLRSPRWRLRSIRKPGRARRRSPQDDYRDSHGRAVAAFQYLGGEV